MTLLQEHIRRFAFDRAAFEEAQYRKMADSYAQSKVGPSGRVLAWAVASTGDTRIRVGFATMYATLVHHWNDSIVWDFSDGVDRLRALIDADIDRLRGFNDDGSWNHGMAFA